MDYLSEQLETFTDLKKILRNRPAVEKVIKVGVLSDQSSQFVCDALRAYGLSFGVEFQIHEADFDQIEFEVYNLQSAMYMAKCEYVVVLLSTEKLLERYHRTDPGNRAEFSNAESQKYLSLYKTIIDNLEARVIFSNFPYMEDGVYGNFGNKLESSFTFQQRKLNFQIMELCAANNNLFILDIDSIQQQFGTFLRVSSKFYYSAQMTLSLEVIPLVAKNLSRIILAAEGMNLKKCLILDLDNTLWGGVIGDDGVEGIQLDSSGIGRAYTDVQKWALELKSRGIILCICSKNSEHLAKEPFDSHPDMVLKLKDISVFLANWENKADNIKYIQQVLNIGFDSMVFVDDNPFERNLIREHLPQVTVPELPSDPADYIYFLRNSNLFETTSHSSEDASRTQRYQEEARRISSQRTFNSIDGYLESLDMIANSGPIDDFSIPRAAQLSQRSNQFNLRTVRYSEEEVRSIASSRDYLTLQVSLKDKFGDYGLISVLIGVIRKKTLFIDTWIMSCRVLKRGVEDYVFNELVEQCRELDIKYIEGEWIETRKNLIVKDHYKDLGFEEHGDVWRFSIDENIPRKHYIST